MELVTVGLEVLAPVDLLQILGVVRFGLWSFGRRLGLAEHPIDARLRGVEVDHGFVRLPLLEHRVLFELVSISNSSSVRETCKILIAWRSWGVITNCWESFWRSLGSSAIVQHAIAAQRPLQPELFAEINLARLLARGDLNGAASFQDHAVIQDIRSVANSQGLAYVVIGDQYADAATA